MSKKNDDFFKEKKPWSKVKDELLGCYLLPYVQKILHTHKPLVYVDCFAGKGKFEDGNPGSPIIALDTMQKCIGSTTMNSWDIQPYFIELNHAEDLRNNLSDYGSITVISGKYEDEISNLLQKKNNCQRRFEIVRKRRRNFVGFRRWGVTKIRYSLAQKGY